MGHPEKYGHPVFSDNGELTTENYLVKSLRSMASPMAL
jgi:hypothetical protein